jgi:hypothetical protein
VRFGIKTIALCDSTNGFLHNFEVYTGQGEIFPLLFLADSFFVGTNIWAENFPDAQMLPVSERIVVHLTGHILNKNHCIYADNWFISVRLVRWMAEHKYLTEFMFQLKTISSSSSYFFSCCFI